MGWRSVVPIAEGDTAGEPPETVPADCNRSASDGTGQQAQSAQDGMGIATPTGGDGSGIGKPTEGDGTGWQ